MSKPFFSMIVTEHDSADFMRKGLDSIRDQTFTDYELIIVCDRCHDNTAEIAREYSDKVIECDHGMASMARNEGLDVAEGEWVLWMDDDDWYLHEFAFELIHEYITEYKKANIEFDILAYAFIWKRHESCRGGLVFNEQGHVWPAIWNKAWRREFIGKERFPEWKHSDDYGFAVKMHPKARFQFFYQPLYYYNFMREGSVSDKIRKGEYTNHDIPEEFWHAPDKYEKALHKGIQL